MLVLIRKKHINLQQNIGSLACVLKKLKVCLILNERLIMLDTGVYNLMNDF